MKPHSALMIALKDHLARSSFTQPEAANLFGVAQLRFCDLTRKQDQPDRSGHHGSALLHVKMSVMHANDKPMKQRLSVSGTQNPLTFLNTR